MGYFGGEAYAFGTFEFVVTSSEFLSLSVCVCGGSASYICRCIACVLSRNRGSPALDVLLDVIYYIILLGLAPADDVFLNSGNNSAVQSKLGTLGLLIYFLQRGITLLFVENAVVSISSFNSSVGRLRSDSLNGMYFRPTIALTSILFYTEDNNYVV